MDEAQRGRKAKRQRNPLPPCGERVREMGHLGYSHLLRDPLPPTTFRKGGAVSSHRHRRIHLPYLPRNHRRRRRVAAAVAAA